jgi:tRNA A-37 threonylcarbamoyl transferase component Bud32
MPLAPLESAAIAAQVAIQRAGRFASVDETSIWEAACQVLVPNYSRAALQAAGALIGSDLEATVTERHQLVDALLATRAELSDQVLTVDEFAQLERRRYAIERRLTEVRASLKALRATPGFFGWLDSAERGRSLRPEQAEAVEAHTAQTRDLASLEAELVRVGNVAARHRRSRLQLEELEGQIRASETAALVDARRLVAERLLSLAGDGRLWSIADARLAPLLARLRARRAMRGLCATLSAELQPTLQRLDELRARSQQGPVGDLATRALLLEHGAAIQQELERVARIADDMAAFERFDALPLEAPDDAWWQALSYVPPFVVPEPVTVVTPPAPRSVSMQEANVRLSEIVEELFDEDTGEHDLFAPSSTGVFQAPGPTVGPAPKAVVDKGRRVGRYLVEGLIGRGGMAEVYLAWQEGHGGFKKRVVLKRMNDDVRAHKDLETMFSREAQIAGLLSHPNLVQVFDYHAVGGEVFIVMEYLEGLSLNRLANRLRENGGGLVEAVVLRLIADAARGLHAAHTLADDAGRTIGIVHRDISPDNLFLTTSGLTKVLDFGIAKRDDLTTLTGKNELKGKIPYMAPEHIHSEPLDARADLFSLGATLYWLLSGQRPFHGHNEVATLHAVLTKEPPFLADAGVTASAGLQALVSAMLAKRREDRPASAREVAVRCIELGAASHDDAASVLERVR